MKIFKFGGASVKDAEGIRNVARVLENQGFNECILVVSAMGKTTNALEEVVNNYFDGKDYKNSISKITDEHLKTAESLFEAGHPVFEALAQIFAEATNFLERNRSPKYDFVYDQVVSSGEMASSRMLSEYLNSSGYGNTWLDAREMIKTDPFYREGNVDWQETENRISKLNPTQSYVTQGFIGSDQNGFTVTLGREGSDYSAAIFAYCMNAEAMTIWKDVPGVMTGDPRVFENAELLSSISYEEAIEMAYYGASVIHPKTLQPLKKKHIPFFVKSFLHPELPGTKICRTDDNQYIESYILKKDQHLMRLATRDFSFIAEEHLSLIFAKLAANNIKISLMQNSAISLALCLEDKFNNIDHLVDDLQAIFNINLLKNAALFTVRNCRNLTAAPHLEGKNILLEQISGRTVQTVYN